MTDLQAMAFRKVIGERDRYKAALEMIAQIRHVQGNAQANHRWTLSMVDAVLERGADVRDLATVEALVNGTFKGKQ
jgi:hypothetical protein